MMITKENLLSLKDFEYIVRLVESYVFRRTVCNIPTYALNKIFATLSRNINKDRYIESLKGYFLWQSSYRRFPKDEEFFREIQVHDLYNFRSRSYWLRRLENYDRKERIDVNEYTIEHILPQNENLSQKWRQALGENWEEIQSKYLHTLGNLTLTRYNSEYQDKFFTEKQQMKGGFKESPLRVNEGLGTINTWDENQIKVRAERLAKKAITVWPIPSLPSEVLENYRPKKQEKSIYSIEDHKYLNKGKVRSLFNAFQKEVLALSDFVTEEFLKHYIAYKAERNFVCVVPQSKRLRLFLNLQIHELNDPKGITRDMSNIGHHGPGDVEVYLNSEGEELFYVLGLVRQALEKQIGDGVE